MGKYWSGQALPVDSFLKTEVMVFDVQRRVGIAQAHEYAPH